MPVTIQLPEPVERRLAERAADAGTTVETLASRLLADAVLREPRTFDEILAPFRQSVAKSGMTEDELGSFFEEVQREVRDEKRGARG